MADEQTLVAQVDAERTSSRRRVLDLGCGRNKEQGAVGVDRDPASQADVLCDLVRIPYPFHSDTDPGHRHRPAWGSFDQVRKDLPPGRGIEVVRKEIRFHPGYLWSWPARIIYRISPNKYEMFFAFLFPARELVCELRIVKREA